MPRRAALLFVLAMAVILAACAAGDDAAEQAPEEIVPDVPDQPEATEPEEVGDAAAGAATTITGTLGGDADLEGGCAWVESRGTRYEVQYPEGYEVARDGSELRGPDGEVIARAGDTVTITGQVADDMMSFCQVGPIFAATEVEAPA